MKSILFFSALLFWVNKSKAIVADLNLGLLQGGFSRAADQNVGRSYNSAGIFANLGKAESDSGFLLGWYMSSIRNTEVFQGVLDQTLTSSDMGPAFRWQIQNKQIFSITFAYGIICKGNFSDLLGTEEINGESYLIKMAMETYLTERFLLGIALNSYSANYKTSLVGSIQSSVGYKNSWTYPSISLSYRYY